MTRKVKKFFWSYDVEKTEKWLGDMGAKGYVLQRINLLTRQFYFEKRNTNQINYHIVYARGGQTSLNRDVKACRVGTDCTTSELACART